MNTIYPNPPEADTMTQARDPFGLASLPELQPPQDGWAAVAAGVQQQQRRRRQWLSGLAVAATVTLVAGIVSILPQTGEAPVATENMLATDTVGGALPPTIEGVAGESAPTIQGQGPDNLAALQKLSQRLEQNLRYLRSGVGAMPAEMVVYQVELEDLVAQVDDAISLQPESSEL
ncbi:MAG TPA: hypothetical protein VFG52_06770, partial [Xanthomonadales bacterium]|nr:hypothetical protein [Xanthomonadales bacterium]